MVVCQGWCGFVYCTAPNCEEHFLTDDLQTQKLCFSFGVLYMVDGVCF